MWLYASKYRFEKGKHINFIREKNILAYSFIVINRDNSSLVKWRHCIDDKLAYNFSFGQVCKLIKQIYYFISTLLMYTLIINLDDRKSNWKLRGRVDINLHVQSIYIQIKKQKQKTISTYILSWFSNNDLLLYK